MKKILILASFLIGISCHAQLTRFTIYTSANCTIIKDIETQEVTLPIPAPASSGYSSYIIAGGIRQSFTPKVGLEIGSRFDYPLTSRLFLTSGVAVSYLRFQRTIEVTGLSSDIQVPVNPVPPTTVGLPFGQIYGWSTMRDADGNIIRSPAALPKRSENIGNTTTLSVQLPMLFGMNFLDERFEVRTGVLLSYLLHATQVKDAYDVSTNAFSDYKDSSKGEFREFQAGLTVQGSYLVGRKVGLDFSAQKFFTSIYDTQSDEDARYNILTLGLSYHL